MKETQINYLTSSKVLTFLEVFKNSDQKLVERGRKPFQDHHIKILTDFKCEQFGKGSAAFRNPRRTYQQSA